MVTQSNSDKSISGKSLLMIAALAVLFQVIWHWGRIRLVFTRGDLAGPDDFLRLHQVQNWMAGQGWYDLSVERMFPPLGTDLHWSRLVDVPIAGLIWLLNLVFDVETATRLTVIIWPIMLTAAVIIVLTFICNRLIKDCNWLMPLVFASFCFSSIAQFVPGRIDHHNIQILLFSLTMLGLVSRETLWGDFLMGTAMVLSITIGLDTMMLFFVILAYLGYEWAVGHYDDGKGLMKIAFSIILSTFLLFMVSFNPAEYFTKPFDVRCDANSLFYAIALTLLAVAFLLLAASSRFLNSENTIKKLLSRGIVGGLVSGTVVVILLVAFPDCANGPYHALSEEAANRWLLNIGEAKPLSKVLEDYPQHWLETAGYLVMILIGGLITLFNPRYFSTRLLAIYVLLVVSALGTLWQVRVLRTGIYASIPFCVILADMSWRFFAKRYADEKPLAYLTQILCVLGLLSATWAIAGALLLGDVTKQVAEIESTANQSDAKSISVSSERNLDSQCFNADDYDELANLPAGIVMTDLLSATAAIVNTQHKIIAGPYHRIERGILDVLDFFETDVEKAAEVADKHKLNYVAFCMNRLKTPMKFAEESVLGKIVSGKLPPWLVQISPEAAPLRVLKVVR